MIGRRGVYVDLYVVGCHMAYPWHAAVAAQAAISLWRIPLSRAYIIRDMNSFCPVGGNYAPVKLGYRLRDLPEAVDQSRAPGLQECCQINSAQAACSSGAARRLCVAAPAVAR